MATTSEPLTYGAYLRVPELLDLQTPLGHPPVHDEMLFIIGQQAQELWFKQVLHDLGYVIDRLGRSRLTDATRLLDRINRILRLLPLETEILEALPPAEFHKFRGLIKPASGFESEQFRELEVASGLRDDVYLKMIGRFLDVGEILRRWPVSLHDALEVALSGQGSDLRATIIRIYENPEIDPSVYLLLEACSEYELRFQEWRFHHIQVVERVIGDRSTGTGGTAGSSYLTRTLGYRFFPELWAARNDLTARGPGLVPGSPNPG